MLEDLMAGVGFLTRLPSFLRHPLSVVESRAILKRRLEQRETDFVALVRRAIYDHPPSPYRQLLRLAGCEYEDLEKLVSQDGVEGALRARKSCRCGGGPTDYQLLEEEAEDGRPRLRLLVHPGVGPLDPEALREAFLTGIGPGSGAEKVMTLAWRQAGMLRVERRAPLATGSGKILHLHVDRRPSAGTMPGPSK